jgi:hypothetical protein
LRAAARADIGVFEERREGDLVIPFVFNGTGDLEGVRGFAELGFEVNVSAEGRRTFGFGGGCFLGGADMIDGMGC